jgi:hypothetical protein
MGLITSIRAPLPATDTAAQPAQTAPRADMRQPLGRTTPVSEPILRDAPQPIPAKPMAVDANLLAARDTAEAAMTATAEAARAAYIRASVAAGINPLPLSGA